MDFAGRLLRKYNPGAIPPPPPPAGGYSTRFGAFLASPYSSAFFPGGINPTADAARQQVLRDTVGVLFQTINNTGGIIGASATAATAFANYDGLYSMDQRMAAANATGLPICFVLNTAPWHMLRDYSGNAKALATAPTSSTSPGGINGAATGGDYSTINSYHVDPAFYSAWAAFCVFLVKRYRNFGYNIKYVIYWSEAKGHFKSSIGRYDYEGLTAEYNAVWDALKADTATKSILMGGPYITTQRSLDSGVYAGSGGGTLPTAVTVSNTAGPNVGSWFGTSVHSTKQVNGVGWHWSGAQMDIACYWRANCHGFDFSVFDGWMFQSNKSTSQGNPHMRPAVDWPAGTPNTVTAGYDGSIVFEDSEMLQLVGNWWRTYIDGTKPLWCVESYPGGNGDPTDLQRMYASAQAGQIDLLGAWLATSAPSIGSQLWNPTTNTRTTVGDAMAATKVITGGLP